MIRCSLNICVATIQFLRLFNFATERIFFSHVLTRVWHWQREYVVCKKKLSMNFHCRFFRLNKNIMVLIRLYKKLSYFRILLSELFSELLSCYRKLFRRDNFSLKFHQTNEFSTFYWLAIDACSHFPSFSFFLFFKFTARLNNFAQTTVNTFSHTR